jgi:hypothetical protein
MAGVQPGSFYPGFVPVEEGKEKKKQKAGSVD